LLLSSKRPSELAQVAGKKKLATEIATEANSVLGIHNAAEAAAAPVAAAPAEGAAPTAAPAAPAGEPAASPEPVAETHAPAGGEKKGVVDVLFTSFIIQ
jgi:hypothetical protein